MSPLLFVLCSCIATLVVSETAPKPLLREHAEFHFERFIQEHNKQYSNEEEKLSRFAIFIENLEKAFIMNQKSGHAKFGITKFSDLTPEEFVYHFTGLRDIGSLNITGSGCNDVDDSQIPDNNAPESFDWRQHNAVTKVKDQGLCGSCYAFSTSGNIEGQYAIKHGSLIELSEQQTVDCDSNSYGCEGGLMTTAFRSIIQQGGIESEADYPYKARQQSCQFAPGKAVVRLTDCNLYNIRSQEKLKQLLYKNGPIAIAVQASNFQVYNGGIMSDETCDSGQVNHAVLLVGYGTENGIPFWTIKNSWGLSFGEQGYIRIQRGENAASCGMMDNGGMSSAIIMIAPEPFQRENAKLHFDHFIRVYEKQYSNEDEKQARLEIFMENLERINDLNQQSKHAIFGITKFSDLTQDEFIQQYTGLKAPLSNLTEYSCDDVYDHQIEGNNAPESFDWRQSNAVTRVKNQQSCGGCYAFSVSGNIEGQYAIKHGRLIELSEQQTIDCDQNSIGCQGGYMTAAFSSIIQQGGIETEADYPYMAVQQACQFEPSKAAVRITACTQYNIVSQEKLKQLLYKNGPISVGVKTSNFSNYLGGVMMDQQCSAGNVNHAVLLVGYGTDNGVPYWLLKNSWDVTFGEQGYIRIQRGESASSCGMMNNRLMSSSIVM
ncbi:hypothetical protein PYW08_000723 [Mythimna loreyi]|uniref:Uncharacterized protein n=1 Tax=Mythimna loreyi TaxID=667449 RepID=A0ACC2R107_9NEOP|nr:hypothetical protein PYW08_000723 [Mythimna loreyi]